ncbi:hypothetical protein ACSS6W_010457 [Trichoderma asperelloides]|uniref:Ribonuclease H1 n=1 Tax=Trichoderma asperellum TaxID=101201 RepID=A0A6V8QYQ9_TRIAP|nr:hypothetical protein LI328DRAFT_171016 [Trichoderma asperelloides]GFP57275.1 ribonuclease H1 [Trichoderma asperellum]
MYSYSRCGYQDERGASIPGRHYRPTWDVLCRSIPKGQLLAYNSTKGILQIQEQEPGSEERKVDDDSIVLCISGRCRRPGVRGARAGWGIYFGPGSPYNASGLLDPGLPQTESRAEIEALLRAMRVVKDRIISDGFHPRRCFIKTHSLYIQQVFPGPIRRWAAAAGRNIYGEKLLYFQLLMDIESLMRDVGNRGEGGEGGTNVLIWCAATEENREADELAVLAILQTE